MTPEKHHHKDGPVGKAVLSSLSAFIRAENAKWSADLQLSRAQEGERERLEHYANLAGQKVDNLRGRFLEAFRDFGGGAHLTMLSWDRRALYVITSAEEPNDVGGYDTTISRIFIDAAEQPGGIGGYRWVRKVMPGEPEGSSELVG